MRQSPLPDESQQPQRLDECRRCALWRNATQAVGGAGPAHAAIMVIGEQPGDQEDLAGLPFVGPAGRLLDAAFAAAGLERDSVYVTNAVKHFKWTPRGKRRLHKTPVQAEIAACEYWLERELASVAPRVLVALGGTALKAVTRNAQATLKEAMAAPFRLEERWVVACWHPSYVLRVPDAEAKARANAELVAALRTAARMAQA